MEVSAAVAVVVGSDSPIERMLKGSTLRLVGTQRGSNGLSSSIKKALHRNGSRVPG